MRPQITLRLNGCLAAVRSGQANSAFRSSTSRSVFTPFCIRSLSLSTCTTSVRDRVHSINASNQSRSLHVRPLPVQQRFHSSNLGEVSRSVLNTSDEKACQEFLASLPEETRANLVSACAQTPEAQRIVRLSAQAVMGSEAILSGTDSKRHESPRIM